MRDYKETIFLPKTTFSLQGVKDEAGIRARFFDEAYHTLFQETAVYLRDGGPRFVLHDGPPYANGDIHMGHALNKILKDFVVRSRHALGQAVSYTPGWDCHGLPIEWQVERNLIADGKSKADYTVSEFRQLCRDYAFGWIDRQRDQFQSLGVIANWENPYLTMSFENEAKIVRMLHMFLMSDMLYRGTKPVLWSAVEETALAEAEVEHHDLKVSSVYVRFILDDPRNRDLTRSVVIWTTTPWTIPANRAVAFNPKIEYGVYKIMGHFEGAGVTATPKNGERLIMAKTLVEKVMADLSVSRYEFEEDFDPIGVVCEHPLKGIDSDGYCFPVPLLVAKHVTDDTGTGFVHIAPEHGPEDFVCWVENNMGPVPETVGPDGAYLPDVPLFAGRLVLRPTPKGDYIFEFTNAEMIKAMEANGTLLASNKVVVSYPHSWRSKAPLFYRNTPQWFMSLDQERTDALDQIEKTEFMPKSGKNRLEAAVANRPDWLISRQRLWGTPMAIFLNKHTGKPLLDDRLNSRVSYILQQEGGDAWWKYDVAHFFKGVDMLHGKNPDDYEKVTDVLDVWFDSGCSHTFVDMGEETQADLYLEGSDQHRGWFGSSLLIGVASEGEAPFKKVLTHGFVLDKLGKKMSKSVGNVVDPLAEAAKYGTDVLRLWVALGDYTQDTRVGDQILKTTADQYKKLRNTMRYCVSNLQGFDPTFTVPFDAFPSLERYILHLMTELHQEVRTAYNEYNFSEVCKLIMDFCANDLSSFYFDIRKDCLYCDRPDSIKRQACLMTLSIIFDELLLCLGPILPFTTEEAFGEVLRLYNVSANTGRRIGAFDGPVVTDHALGVSWDRVREVLTRVTAALEVARQAKMIGSALDAKVTVEVTADYAACFAKGASPAEVFRTSQAELVLIEGSALVGQITVTPAEGKKCARSWRIVPDVGSDPRYPDLSARDADAVALWDEQKA